MSREETIRLATEEIFDIVIIGGGINGAAIAWEAISRGLNVALVEQKDFGGQTSSGCFKIVHGGVRYLQHLNFSRMQESVAEQRALRHIAPHLVYPLPFLIPCFGVGKKSRWLMHLGFSLYEALYLERNEGLSPERCLPRHQLLSTAEVFAQAPGLKSRSVSGGLCYYDAQMSNCERLSYAFVKSAALHGATVLNYASAERFIFDFDEKGVKRIQRVECTDCETGKAFSLQTSYVINATGPWAKSLVRRFCVGETAETVAASVDGVFSKGIQAVLPDFGLRSAVVVESAHEDATAVVSRGGRSYFLVPWRGVTLAGTGDALFQGNPEEYALSKVEVDRLIAEIASGYEQTKLSPKHVQLAFGGLRTIDRSVEQAFLRGASIPEGTVGVAQEETVIDHGLPGCSFAPVKNLLSVTAVKYTTARALAEEIVNRLAIKLFSVLPSKTSTLPIYGGDYPDEFSLLAELTAATPHQYDQPFLRSLILDYGTSARDLLALIAEEPMLAEKLAPTAPTRAVEIVHAVRNEHALHLSDVVMRRTLLGQRGFPGEQALLQAARIMEAEGNWDSRQTEREILAVRKLFAVD